MHFGVVMFPTDYAIRPDDLARELEARGFESMPIGLRLEDPVGKIAALRARWAKAGRDPKALDVTIFNVKGEPGAVDTLRRASASCAVFAIPPAGRNTILPLLDDHAKLMR